MVCMITDSSLPPSNAGIGSRLNIANARDNIAINAKNSPDQPASRIIDPIFVAPTGQLKFSNALLLSFGFEDESFTISCLSISNVIFVCAFISLAAKVMLSMTFPFVPFIMYSELSRTITPSKHSFPQLICF